MIRLADAIREGCKIRPRKARFSYGDNNSSCITKAAVDGFENLTGTRSSYNGSILGRFTEYFPYLDGREKRSLACPHEKCGWTSNWLFDILIHLNDSHRETSREEIANWVDTIEPYEVEIAQQVPIREEIDHD